MNLGGGCLYVPDEDLKQFYAKYLKYIIKGNNEVNLTEQPLICDDGNSYSPVIIDVDLKYGSPGCSWKINEIKDAVIH